MTMTPKQAYERRRAEREARRADSEKRYGRPDIVDERDAFVDDLMDRFVTSAERIADALEMIARRPDAGGDTVFASRHNDDTGECEPVHVEPEKVRELREKMAAPRDWNAFERPSPTDTGGADDV